MIKRLDVTSGDFGKLKGFLDSRNNLNNIHVIASVDRIINDVRKEGDSAVCRYTKEFDGVHIESSDLKVTKREIEEACQGIDRRIADIIKKAAANIREFHQKQKENSWFTAEKEGVILGQMYTPLQCVGIYVPAGTAPLPSSVLMNAIPAKVAGVDKIIMCTPPGKDGCVNPVILAAAREAGVDEIYKIGGAQAVAAMAFGTETVPKVDKITGPGNIYVAMAKKAVYGYCDIDMIAGPSEIAILADETANPSFAAADMLSQAEHDTMASAILVTTSHKLAEEVEKELEKQIQNLNRREIAFKSISTNGMIVIVSDMEQGAEVINMIAPEHLEICTAEPFSLLSSIRNAGAIFLGHYASEPLGDYFAGPNHVLPTSGTARFFSPLNVGDFIKKSSVIYYTKKALDKVKEDVVKFAEAEELDAHANAIKVRFKQD